MVKKAAIFFLLLSFTLSGRLLAEEAAKITTRTMKGISGEVSAISKDFIAIIYRRDQARGSEEEIALPLAKNVRVEHKRNLAEIGVGDTVDVQFEEVAEAGKEGRTRRVATVISFLRSAVVKPEVSSDSSAEEER